MSLQVYPESWLVPGEGAGTFAIRKPNGRYVSVDPFNGNVQEQTYVGSWESAHRVGNELVYLNEGVAYALPLAVGI